MSVGETHLIQVDNRNYYSETDTLKEIKLKDILKLSGIVFFQRISTSSNYLVFEFYQDSSLKQLIIEVLNNQDEIMDKTAYLEIKGFVDGAVFNEFLNKNLVELTKNKLNGFVLLNDKISRKIKLKNKMNKIFNIKNNRNKK